MIAVLALSHVSDLCVRRLSFCATKTEQDAAARDLCQDFSDDPNVHVMAFNLPGEAMPTFEQLGDPGYQKRISERCMDALGIWQSSSVLAGTQIGTIWAEDA